MSNFYLIFIFAAIIFVLFLFSSENFPFKSEKCPANYCLQWVYGSCIGSKQRYMERTCFQYPDNAKNSIECEQRKILYYEKNFTTDEAC